MNEFVFAICVFGAIGITMSLSVILGHELGVMIGGVTNKK
jgi:hypothetical protein